MAFWYNFMPVSISPETFHTFGDLLRHLRRRLQLTQQDLAIAVGYSREQIVKLEHNKRLPDVTTIQALFIPALALERDPLWAERLVQLAHRHPPSPASTVHRHHSNIPVALTPFIGRSTEMATLRTYLAHHRLVTVIGAGGLGKSSFVQEFGRRAMKAYGDGVWWVDLATLRDGSQIIAAIATVLGLPVASTSLASVQSHLQTRDILLLLDTCEHLLPAIAELCELLLQTVPQLHILATSRETFGTLSALIYRLPPLSIGGEDGEHGEAVELFFVRAVTANPSFTLTAETLPIVQDICSRLDGLPLAIELAATRVRVMSVFDIATRLEDRFSLLTSGNQTALPRHQTLRATVDWSYALLDERERTLLATAGLFVGRVSIEALLAVAEMPDGADVLVALVDKSFVNAEPNGGNVRYYLSETVRAYALARLQESGKIAILRKRFAAYYLTFATTTAPMLYEPHQPQGYRRFDEAHPQIRAVLEWAILYDGELAMRLFVAMWWYWFRRGFWQEGAQWATQLLTGVMQPKMLIEGQAFIGGALLQGVCGDIATMQLWLDSGRPIITAYHDYFYMARITEAKSLVVPDYTSARTLLLEAIAYAQRSGNRWLEADLYSMIGDRAMTAKEADEASSFFRRSLALFQSVGDQDVISYPLGNLGRLALEKGAYIQARAAFEESITICRRAGNLLGVADWLKLLAEVAYKEKDGTTLSRSLREGLVLCHRLSSMKGMADYVVRVVEWVLLPSLTGKVATDGVIMISVAERLMEKNALFRTIDPDSYSDFDRVMDTLRHTMEPEVFMLAWARGQLLTPTQVVELTSEYLQE